MSARQKIVLGLILITFGGMIYLSYRPTSILLFRVLDVVGLMPFIEDWRTMAFHWQPSEFVVYSLPGGLWSAAYILLVHALLEHHTAVLRITVASIIPMVGIVSELMQSAELLPGTYQLTDLWCYALPLFILLISETLKNTTLWQVFSTASVVSN